MIFAMRKRHFVPPVSSGHYWLLDVHFAEDFCRVEDENVQQCLNILRKVALNGIKIFKTKNTLKRPLSKIMFDCLLDCENLLPILASLQN
jgi:hypothetical protein